MQLKKRYIIGPALAFAAIGSILGGVALANGGGTSATSTKDQLIEKAASELGVDPAKLQDALAQARKSVMLERLDAYLKAAVEKGTITQGESDAIKAWIDSRPAAVDKLAPKMFGLPGMHGRGGHHGFRGFGGFGMRGPHGQMAPDTGESTDTPATSTGLNL